VVVAVVEEQARLLRVLVVVVVDLVWIILPLHN
jgi:hypothetical protein